MFESTFKNFKINFNTSNARNSFSSGDIITGHISFDLTKETKITSISMALTGKANIHWSQGGGGKRRRKHYSAKLDFFDLKAAIVQENGAVGKAIKLQPGTHLYPFTCQIPQGDFPSSFKGIHGQIVYSLTAPLSGSNSMTLCCLWCSSGPITMTVSVEKKAFLPGEMAKVICEFSNASSKTATPKVKLQQKQIYYTHNKVHQRIGYRHLASTTGEPVRAHTSDVHSEIRLTIPAASALTISNCSILVNEYMIEVNLSVIAHPDLTVLFPIILCDEPVFPQPPTVLYTD
ncbi:arrestin domain-containing protein 3-like isoform X2 [Embiotoca jacksoni]|uniref:arrestin domain-containing protein 3-like isoform X2 n=1 Tax=Embiotoca jacksoni TaxID=100190 RepID=UPI003704BB18